MMVIASHLRFIEVIHTAPDKQVLFDALEKIGFKLARAWSSDRLILCWVNSNNHPDYLGMMAHASTLKDVHEVRESATTKQKDTK